MVGAPATTDVPAPDTGRAAQGAPGGQSHERLSLAGKPVGSDEGERTGLAGRPCPRSLSPIVLGQTLATSGLVGATVQGLRTGLAAWAQSVNAVGGVQCHPVQLIQLDDASDPARVSANWNSLVKDSGAVAVLAAGVPITIAALRSSAERDKVPVIGGDMGSVDWFSSPYLFPSGGPPLASYDGAVIEATRAADGADKTGLLYCVEASICTSVKNRYPISAKRAGAALGPLQAISLTQPSFTSECQAMKEAGVNSIFVAMDGSAAVRLARSCASLKYFPVFSSGSLAISALAAADEGLRRNTMFLGTGMVPYTETDHRAVKPFRDAMKRYAPSAIVEQNALLGWAAGKLFGAALENVASQARRGEVTTALILDGLWELKKEKLDGLGPGVTFTEGAAATAPDCYYGIRLDGSGFSAPSGSNLTCLRQRPAAPSHIATEDRTRARADGPWAAAAVNRQLRIPHATMEPIRAAGSASRVTTRIVRQMARIA